MLPFLKKNQSIGATTTVLRKSDTSDEDSGYEGGLDHCSQELIDAVQAGDKSRVSRALQDAFDILESMPHEEAEPSESEKE